MKQKNLSNLILIAYALMMIVSLVSAVDLFKLSHPDLCFGWVMSIAIEISIAALLMINRSTPGMKSVIYVLGFITLFQICANTYSAYIHIEDISPFAELFALDDWEAIDQKRILAFATGGVLPAICLSLIYIQNEVRNSIENNTITTSNNESENISENKDCIDTNREDAQSSPDEADESNEQPQESSISEPVENQPDTTEESSSSPDIPEDSHESPIPETNSDDNTHEDPVSVSIEESEGDDKKSSVTKKAKKTSWTKKAKKASGSKNAKKTKKTSGTNKTKKSKTPVETEGSVPDDMQPVEEPSILSKDDNISTTSESVEDLANTLNNIRHGRTHTTMDSFTSMY